VSGLLYPANLPGLTWDSERTPIFNTGVQPAVSGKESRIAYQQYPRFYFDLQYELLRDYVVPSDLKALIGLFIDMQGRYDTFLYTDPTFNAVTTFQFGTGDGVTQNFQLIANYQNSGGPGGPELIQNLNGAPSIFKAAVLQTLTTHYTISATGMVSFVTAPAAAAALTWTGSFYYRCRFDADELTAKQFAALFWATKSVRLKSIKL